MATSSSASRIARRTSSRTSSSRWSRRSRVERVPLVLATGRRSLRGERAPRAADRGRAACDRRATTPSPVSVRPEPGGPAAARRGAAGGSAGGVERTDGMRGADARTSRTTEVAPRSPSCWNYGVDSTRGARTWSATVNRLSVSVTVAADERGALAPRRTGPSPGRCSDAGSAAVRGRLPTTADSPCRSHGALVPGDLVLEVDGQARRHGSSRFSTCLAREVIEGAVHRSRCAPGGTPFSRSTRWCSCWRRFRPPVHRTSRTPEAQCGLLRRARSTRLAGNEPSLAHLCGSVSAPPPPARSRRRGHRPGAGASPPRSSAASGPPRSS